MTPYQAHLQMLQRRYERLVRYAAYRQDGKGNVLSDQAFVMVCLCVSSTHRDIARMEVGR